MPQNVLAYVGVPREKNNQISSMNSFVRNVGGSIGIAVIATSLSRIAQQRRHTLVGNAAPGTPAYERMVGGLTQMLIGHGSSSADATHQAYGMVSGMIDRQATTLAYVEVVSMMAVVIIGLVPFLLIMKRNKPAVGEQTVVH